MRSKPTFNTVWGIEDCSEDFELIGLFSKIEDAEKCYTEYSSFDDWEGVTLIENQSMKAVISMLENSNEQLYDILKQVKSIQQEVTSIRVDLNS